MGQAARARRAKQLERELRQSAERQADEQRARLVRSHLLSGDRMLGDGDATGALLWYVEAFSLAKSPGTAEDAHRIRIASILRRCPKLEQLLVLPHTAQVVAFAGDDRRLVTLSGMEPPRNRWDAGGSGEAILWDPAASLAKFLALTVLRAQLRQRWIQGHRRALPSPRVAGSQDVHHHDLGRRILEASPAKSTFTTPPAGPASEFPSTMTASSFSRSSAPTNVRLFPRRPAGDPMARGPAKPGCGRPTVDKPWRG